MGTPREYEITVSSVLARSTGSIIGAWVNEWVRAKAKVDAIMATPPPAPKAPSGKDPRVASAEAAAKELERIRERENNKILSDVAKIASAEEKAHEKAARHVAAIKERYFREEQQRGEKADTERQQRNERIISGSLSNMRKVAAAASRVAGEVIGGMGVDTSLSSLIGKGVRNESLAAKISGYGYIEGEKGAAGVRQDPKAILEDARRAAQAAKLDTGEVLEGLGEFTKKSSELGLGRDILKDLAVFAKATGSNFKDVASSAGDIAKKLGDVPNKAEAVKGALSVLAKEGKFGAIDFSDLAKVIPTVIGGANKFQQGTAGAISQLGVALQIAKSYGGAKGPAQAATSAANFVNYLTSAAGTTNLLKGGLKDTDIFADKEHKQLRSVEDIVVKALEATGGDLTKMSKMFRNVRAGSVLQGFGQIYSEAEGKQKGSGAAAVRDIFKSYGAQTSQKDLEESFKVNAGTTESQVIEFNNTMEEVANELRANLLPALKEGAPVARDIAKAFAGVVSWAANNPGMAITGAIVGSIGKAAIGEMIAKSISSFGPAGIAVGLLAAAATAAAVAIADYESKSETAKGKVDKDPALIARAQKQLKETGTIDKDTIDEIARRRAELESVRDVRGFDKKTGERIAGGSDTNFGELSYTQILAAKVTGGSDEIADAEGRGKAAKEMGKDKIEALASKMDEMIKAFHDSKPKGPLDVNIVGGIPTPGPTAPTGGTVQQ